jgi:hypothetical protein
VESDSGFVEFRPYGLRCSSTLVSIYYELQSKSVEIEIR